MPFACEVDIPARMPPPELATGASSAASSGASGAGGSSAATTSSGPGPATVCECAAAAFTPSSPCADCFHEVSGIDCADPVTIFQKAPGSAALLVALAACKAGAQCIADTLATHPARDAYLDVLACVCLSCGSACAAPSEVSCDAGKIPVDAGSDAGSDAEVDAASDANDDAADADG